MFENGSADLRDALGGALSVFSLAAQCPVGLFECKSDGNLIETVSCGEFREFCQKIRETEEGDKLCISDHLARATQALKSTVPALTICHAGLYNQTIPIFDGTKPFAVLMFGQMSVPNDNRQAKALSRRESTIAKLGLDEGAAKDLRTKYRNVKEVSRVEIDSLTTHLSELGGLVLRAAARQEKRDERNALTIHDLNIGLQAILARTENLNVDISRLDKDPSVKSELPAKAKLLLRDCLRMRQLTWNLSGSLHEYCFGMHRLDMLVQEAAELYQYEADGKKVQIRIPSQEPLVVEMSRDHLSQAINNLVHNAVKYSFRGRDDRPRHIGISYVREPESCIISIENYGVGILEDEIERVFDRGYQGKLTENEYRSGSGIGLFITNEIVRAHRGEISITSIPTSGTAYITTVSVRLPYRRSTGGGQS